MSIDPVCPDPHRPPQWLLVPHRGHPQHLRRAVRHGRVRSDRLPINSHHSERGELDAAVNQAILEIYGIL